MVVGASAGGLGALVELAEKLPADFGAALFVVLHVPEDASSHLAEILGRAGKLPAAAALEGAAIEPGTITVAPPGHHLVLEERRMRVIRGPKVNASRPSVDVLFHSAARAHGARAIGVVLSGMLQDGTLGLRAIKRRGGIAVVQQDAVHPGMTTSAIANVEVDAVVPAREMAQRLTMFLAPESEGAMAADDQTELEAGFDVTEERAAPGDPTIFRCPECGGALWELEDGALVTYACHVGHTYAAESLMEQQGDAVEAAMWTAVRMLQERAGLLQRLAERMRGAGQERSAQRFETQVTLIEQRAALVREAILERAHEPEAGYEVGRIAG